MSPLVQSTGSLPSAIQAVRTSKRIPLLSISLTQDALVLEVSGCPRTTVAQAVTDARVKSKEGFLSAQR